MTREAADLRRRSALLASSVGMLSLSNVSCRRNKVCLSGSCLHRQWESVEDELSRGQASQHAADSFAFWGVTIILLGLLAGGAYVAFFAMYAANSSQSRHLGLA
jgi:hypothetical protein